MEILSERLKWLREEKRYSQKEVASGIGVSLNGYQKLEQGDINPKIDRLIRIAKFYGETTDFLLGLSDYTRNLLDLEKRLTVLKQEVSYLSEKYMNYHFRLQGKVDDDIKNEIVDELRSAEFDYKTTFGTFMDEFYYIPESKPENDEWISEHLPLRIEINDNNLLGVYNVMLLSYRGEELSILHSNAEKESAEKEAEFFKKYYRI